MKFQNPSLNFFFERTDGRTDGHTDARTSRNQYAPHFFTVGGIKNYYINISVKEKSKYFRTKKRIISIFFIMSLFAIATRILIRSK